METNLFNSDPRKYLFELIDQGQLTDKQVVDMAISFMSKDDVRDMLDDNELSPRFNEGSEDEK